MDWRAALKRTVDVVVAAVVLLLAAPLLVVIALVVVLDSSGPVFYRAERVGRGRRPLRMLKFRKMHVDAAGPALTLSGDRRFTRVGALLARTRLDELPQLWHVLRGDMSLIGPRPEDPRFVALWPDEYEEILRVRPGLTGWTQVAFADERRILDPDNPVAHYVTRILPQKVALDRMYAARPGLMADLHIVAATFRTMTLRQEIAVHRESGAMSIRRRPAAAPRPAPAEPVAEPAAASEAPALAWTEASSHEVEVAGA
jgi:lipopolysaccharide/colanic/teichoic acid biosynthesis glycosyltransferase